MILHSQTLSTPGVRPWPFFSALTFVLGLAVGAGLSQRPIAFEPAPREAAAIPAQTSVALARLSMPAEVIRVIDGDTFDARVPLWPGLEVTTKVRLRDIDTPEMKARCPDERLRAEAARDALRAILDQGQVGISRVAHDKYAGRVLADASTRATTDVSASLIAAGMGRRYSGGRRETWCR